MAGTDSTTGPKCRRIADELRAAIRGGTYRAGDRLPARTTHEDASREPAAAIGTERACVRRRRFVLDGKSVLLAKSFRVRVRSGERHARAGGAAVGTSDRAG